MDSSSVSAEVAIVLTLRLFLGFFFLSSAIGKLRHQRSFIQGVLEYQLLPDRAARALGVVLPWLELTCALLLLVGLAVPIIAAASLFLLLCFTTAVIVNLQRGRRIKCNCYGIAGTAIISWGTVVRNLVLLFMAASLAGLAPTIINANQWLGFWQLDRAVFSSISASILICLLLSFCFVVTQILEWAVDTHGRVVGLQR